MGKFASMDRKGIPWRINPTPELFLALQTSEHLSGTASRSLFQKIPKIRARLKNLHDPDPAEQIRHKRWLFALRELPLKRPLRERDLFRLHACLSGVPSQLRKRPVSLVGQNKKRLFVFPGPEAVPALWEEFLEWRERTKTLPKPLRAIGSHLILMCIHPFQDGNGRMGRFIEYADFKGRLPHPELLVHLHFDAYLEAIKCSKRSGTLNPFLHFMLSLYTAACRDQS